MCHSSDMFHSKQTDDLHVQYNCMLFATADTKADDFTDYHSFPVPQYSAQTS